MLLEILTLFAKNKNSFAFSAELGKIYSENLQQDTEGET